MDFLTELFNNNPLVIEALKVLLIPLILLGINFLLDLELSLWLIKYLHFLNFFISRTTFRDRPIQISGKWTQIWSEISETRYDSKSETKIKQFGRYCYSEFKSETRTYIFFGKLEGQYLYGKWFDKESDRKNNIGYFGSFQLKINEEGQMDGLWIGHSASISKIKSGPWLWKKQHEKSFFQKIKDHLFGMKKILSSFLLYFKK